ncbi:MAG: hypothetical protein WCZ89_03435 [Phycisphaerae bacterium]
MDDIVFKMIAPLWKDKESIIAKIDLQFDNGIPYAVLEWLDTPEGAVPVTRVELDPKYLKTCIGESYQYLYQIPINWPTKSTN